MQRLEADARCQPDSLRLYPSEQTTDLLYGQLAVQSVSDRDAQRLHTTRDALAHRYRARIVQVVGRYRLQHSVVNILREVGLVLLVVLAFYFVVRFANRFLRWLYARLSQREAAWFRGMRLGTCELFTPGRELETALLLNALRWVAIFLIISLVLPLLFGIFPGTQDMADVLLSYVLTHFLIITMFGCLLKGLRFLKEEIGQGDLTIEGFYSD